jgi:hypothetical protein
MFVRITSSAVFIGVTLLCPAAAGEPVWIELFSKGLPIFKMPHDGWEEAGAVTLDAANPRKLIGTSGSGVWYNGPKGSARNLFTKQKFGDLEVALDFMMSKGSNSGIKFHGHYEIQIMDSFGKKDLTGDSCGGIYPRAEVKPRYHHIDKGIAPKVNACKPPGDWQTLQAIFQAPRFDAGGKKIANARIVRATLNGQAIHEDLELQWPTGDRWKGPEFAEGPLMLQGDHGPVAFRNVRIRATK